MIMGEGEQGKGEQGEGEQGRIRVEEQAKG